MAATNVQAFSGDLDIAGAITSNLEVGTANLFVDTVTGNVGIGLTTPKVDLHIYGGATDSVAYLGEGESTDKTSIFKYTQGDGNGTGVLQFGHFGDSFGVSPKTLCIKKGGNVGIGKTDPGEVLDVNGTVASLASTITSSTGALINLTDTSETPSIFRAIAVSGGTYIQSGTEATSDSRADLYFTSMYAGTNFMTIKGSSGNVGIGTNNPSTNILELYRNSTNGATISLKSSGDYIATIGKKSSSSTDQSLQFLNTQTSGSGESFRFLTTSDGTNFTEALKIMGNRHIGIGKTPYQHLDVNGDIHCGGYLTMTGSSYLAYNARYAAGNNGYVNFYFTLRNLCAHQPGIIKIHAFAINSNSGSPFGWDWAVGFNAVNCGSHAYGFNDTLYGSNPGTTWLSISLNSSTGVLHVQCRNGGRSYLMAECEVSYYGGIYL